MVDSQLKLVGQCCTCVPLLSLPTTTATTGTMFATSDVVKMLVHAFISSRHDYCNSLLPGVGDGVLRKLQFVQNAAASQSPTSINFTTSHLCCVICIGFRSSCELSSKPPCWSTSVRMVWRRHTLTSLSTSVPSSKPSTATVWHHRRPPCSKNTEVLTFVVAGPCWSHGTVQALCSKHSNCPVNLCQSAGRENDSWG